MDSTTRDVFYLHVNGEMQLPGYTSKHGLEEAARKARKQNPLASLFWTQNQNESPHYFADQIFWTLHHPTGNQSYTNFAQMTAVAREVYRATGRAPTYGAGDSEALYHFTEEQLTSPPGEQLTEPAKAAAFQPGDRVVLDGLPSPVMLVTRGATAEFPDQVMVTWFKELDLQRDIFPPVALKKAD